MSGCGARRKYPDILTISSSGPAAVHRKERMGEYRRMDGVEAYNRPIWKKQGEDRYFFYTKYNSWMVGPDYNKAAGWIKSAERGLERIPGKGWTSDPQLTVEGEF